MKYPEGLTDEDFMYWVSNNCSDEKTSVMHDFHEYLRNTELKSGTVVDYLKDVEKDLTDDGKLPESADGSAARKFREFLRKTTEEGENQ
ncbi:MAG: hypothetical protein ABEJ56_00070 [Candidatus Nanohaloarchaea archaeon]